MVDIPVKKSRVSRKALAVLVSVFAGLGIAWQLYTLDYTTPRVPISDIRIVNPSNMDLSIDIHGSGRIKASRSTVVVAREAGDVLHLAVRPGMEFRAGDVLVQLVNSTLHDELRQAEVELQTRKNMANIANLELKETRGQYLERVSQSRNDYKTAKGVLLANEDLMSLPSPPISRLEHERSRRDYQVAKERYQRAKVNMKNYNDIELARVQQTEIELNDLANKIKRLKERLSDLSIVMPEDGIMQELHVENGQRVNAGDQIAGIYAKGEYYLEVEVSALRANRASVGMPAIVTLFGEEYTGEVIRIDPQVRGSLVLVDISFKHPQPERIQVNMFANARVLVGEREDVLVIPTPQNAREFGTMNLYVVDSADPRYAVYRSATFGAMSASHIEVVSGLAPNDKVILSDISRQAQGAERVRLR